MASSPLEDSVYHQTSWLDSLGAVACCERISTPVPALLLGLTKYPYSSNRPSPAALHMQPLASNSGANQQETEMVVPQAPVAGNGNGGALSAPPRVPEPEMMEALVAI